MGGAPAIHSGITPETAGRMTGFDRQDSLPPPMPALSPAMLRLDPPPDSPLQGDPAQIKLLLVPFRSDTSAIDEHPEVEPFLRAGWGITQATPRLVEGYGLQFLVVLHLAAS